MTKTRKYQIIAALVFFVCLIIVFNAGHRNATETIVASRFGKKTAPLVRNFEERSFDNAGECVRKYGRVKIFLAHDVANIFESKYKDSIASLTCYAERKNYPLIAINPFEDTLSVKYCSHIKDLRTRKHCAAAAYLNSTDWLYVLDADTGVINFNHCLEDYIDLKYDILHYERFHNAEIASDNYVVRNTKFTRNYLTKWAELDAVLTVEFQNANNGALHYHLLNYIGKSESEVSECKKLFLSIKSWQDYNTFFICLKKLMNGQRVFDKIKILRRGLGFVRDSWVTHHYFSDFDFMLHAMKPPDNVHFVEPVDVGACTDSNWTLPVKPSLKVDMNRMVQLIRAADAEALALRPSFLLHSADVSDCWPDCTENIKYKFSKA